MKRPDSHTSRREFLRGLSLGTAGLAAGTNLRALAEALSQNKGRKLGVALLGLGGYAKNQLAPALKQTKLCYLAGVVTGHPEKAKEWAATYDLKKTNLFNYETLEQIADNRDIDIIYVVTPPALHPEFVIRAAKTGKHIISEKPMATSVADCDRMIAACRAAKVKLAVGYRLHYDPYHREMVRLAREEELGPFRTMTGNFSFVIGQRVWRIDKKLAGGGPMMDVGIYVMHAACMAANGLAPLSVTAQEEPKKNPELFNEVEETLRWTMEFSDGAKCEALTSFNQSANQFRAEGKKGWLEIKPAFNYGGLAAETSRGPLRYPAINQQAAQMDDFADCILTGRDTQVPGELGRRDIQIITAIYQAARTGKRVEVRSTTSKI